MPDTLHPPADCDFVYTRNFNASPALLWRAITDPAIVPRWLGGDTNPMVQCDTDLRPGGSFRWVWQYDGQPTGVTGRFLTVEAPHLLVNTELFDEDWTGGETTVTQTLTEIAPQTTQLTMTVRYGSPAARDAAAPEMESGLAAHYAQLDRLLPTLIPGRSDFRLTASGDRQIAVSRSFAAPKAAVIRAHTDADLLRRWMGSAEMPLEVCEMEARPGGSFRYVWRMQDGTRINLSGRITSIDADSIRHTEIFDPDWTGGPTDVVTRFTEADGRTTVTVEITYSATPARDQVLASGMGEGMAGSYDLLDDILAR
jgi:uncharacterized protein YndB with AHSA1/START domain